MSRENLHDLMDRLGTPPPLPLPLVFLHGHLLGVGRNSMELCIHFVNKSLKQELFKRSPNFPMTLCVRLLVC